MKNGESQASKPGTGSTGLKRATMEQGFRTKNALLPNEANKSLFMSYLKFGFMKAKLRHSAGQRDAGSFHSSF